MKLQSVISVDHKKNIETDIVTQQKLMPFRDSCISFRVDLDAPKSFEVFLLSALIKQIYFEERENSNSFFHKYFDIILN